MNEHDEHYWHSYIDIDLLYINTEMLRYIIKFLLKSIFHISCQTSNTSYSVSFINHQAFRGSTGSEGAGGAVWLAPSMTKIKLLFC